MENTITITATKKEAVITLNYKGKEYVQKCIPTKTGARYEGSDFCEESELPDDLVDALTGFVSYNLMNALRNAR